MESNNQVYRNGPVGALQDEYERATGEIIEILRHLSPSEYLVIRDPETKDMDCRSIQSILNHLVRSGYGYANYIRKQFGNNYEERIDNYALISPDVAIQALNKMLAYHAATLEDKWDISGEEILGNIMKTTWGQDYDFDQLFEHAIVHMLRHRRQIERFLIQPL